LDRKEMGGGGRHITAFFRILRLQPRKFQTTKYMSTKICLGWSENRWKLYKSYKINFETLESISTVNMAV